MTKSAEDDQRSQVRVLRLIYGLCVESLVAHLSWRPDWRAVCDTRRERCLADDIQSTITLSTEGKYIEVLKV